MAKQDTHPEQDPAEGSRETIDRELARQRLSDRKGAKAGEQRKPADKAAPPAAPDHRPM